MLKGVFRYLFITFFLNVFLSNCFLFADVKKIDVVYGNNVQTVEMLLIDGNGYLKAKDIETFYNAQFTWFQVSKKIVFNFGENKISFVNDSDLVFVNDQKRRMNKKAFLREDVFYVPLEVLLTKTFKEITGYKANWYLDRMLLEIKQYEMLVPDKKVEDIEKSEFETEISTQTAKGNLEGINQDAAEVGVEDPVVIPLESRDAEDEDLVDKSEEEVFFKDSDEKKTSLINMIVVDAGHGGKDPGAIGPRKINEKDVNLKVALKLRKMLKKFGKKVILTRNKDKFIKLRDRVKVANEKGANLFISIHANAARNKTKRGFEVYILSENASDSEAQEVAAFENKVLEYEDYTADDLETILLSMSLNAFMNESNEVAYFISKRVSSNIKIENGGVKQAGFVVLKGARMPSILVELAYLSNPKDERLLVSGKFQDMMADAICEAVLEYEEHLIKNQSVDGGIVNK